MIYLACDGMYTKDAYICPNSTLKTVLFKFYLNKIYFKEQQPLESSLRIFSVQSFMVKVVHGSSLSTV